MESGKKDGQGYRTIRHTFLPVYKKDSRILILGTLPSVKSRENNFYYGHPKNRFWRLLADLYGEQQPETVEEKTALILRHDLALWDVIAQCDIIGSSDSSIRNVIPSDVAGILAKSSIQIIAANGGKAYELYNRYQRASTGMEARRLPSTSPANASWSLERLKDAWRAVLL